MSSSNGAVASERKVQRHRAKALANDLYSFPCHGEIITWQVKRDSARTYKDVQNALTKAGLDPSVARKIMPRFAFTRACKKLKEKAVFDVVKDTADKVRFQLTKKTMANDEWKYTKDTELVLDKITGVIECKKKDIEKLAQSLLDEALEIRTTSDITHIVQKLFEKNGDLFSLRDTGGVYFVPKQFLTFVKQVEDFIEELGGEMGRFPVPEGTKQGDKSIQTAVADAFHNLIKDHEEAVDLLTINTRKDTMEAAAERIKLTRVKIEAYASYLQGKSKDLLKEVDEANKKLSERIKDLATEKENSPEGPTTLCDHSVTQVLRWMGLNDWNFQEAKAVMEGRGINLAPTTIRGQLWVGRSKREEEFGKPAILEAKYVKELESERKKVKV